jgi:hypothetical protein
MFDDLTRILMQEEERRKSVNNKFQNSDQALMAKGKKPYKGKPWVKNKGGKPDVKLYQGGVSSKTTTNVKKNGTCNYCGKFGHYAYECRKKKFNESKYRRQEGNFVDREAEVSDDLKNLKLFISDVAY